MKALICDGAYFLPRLSTQASPLSPAMILYGTRSMSFLHHRIGEAAADQALDRKERVLGVGHRLAFRRLADQALARLGECNHRGRRAHALAILDHLGIPAFHHGDAGIRRAEIDTDDLAHGHLISKAGPGGRGSTVPIPRK